MKRFLPDDASGTLASTGSKDPEHLPGGMQGSSCRPVERQSPEAWLQRLPRWSGTGSKKEACRVLEGRPAGVLFV